MEGLTKIYSVTNELIKESSPDYYSIVQYLDATFSAHSINKCFALEVEICILKKLNYDLSIPTAYSLLDSLLKANENVNFLKVRNDYNITEGEILLRVASIDNNFLKYKASTLAMAIYEILSFNICKDKMQVELIPEDGSIFDTSFTMSNERRAILKPKTITEGSSYVIAEEEQRLILATRYLNEKSKLHKIIKKIILKTCTAIKKKIPKYYYDYDHHLTEELKSYISTYKKSKQKFLKKFKEKRMKKKNVNTQIENKKTDKIVKEEESKDKEKIRGSSKEAIMETEKKEVVKKVSDKNFMRTNINKVKMKLKRRQKKQKKKEQGGKMEKRDKAEEAEIFGIIKNKNMDNNQKNKKNKQKLLLTGEKRSKEKSSKKKKLIDSNNDEYQFNICKNKIVKKLKKYLRKISRLKYQDLPKKFCSSYVLQGNEIKLYLKIDSNSEDFANKCKEVNIYNVSSNVMSSKEQQGKKMQEQTQETSYIIGSRTKSTDGHLTYYFNYINKLRSRLIHGIKYALKRINKIKKTEIHMVITNLRHFIKKKKIKKLERKKEASLKKETKGNVVLNRDKNKPKENKMKHKNTVKIKKNIPLLKQLHYEVKTFFLWLKKASNIEIRPLLKFTDLRFLHQANRYKKYYFKHVKKIVKLLEEMKNVKEKNKDIKTEEDNKQKIFNLNLNDRRNRTLIRENINTISADISKNAYIQKNNVYRIDKNVQENKPKDKKQNLSDLNNDLLKRYAKEVRKSIVEEEKYFRSYCEKFEKMSEKKDAERVAIEKTGRRQRPRSSRKRRNERSNETPINLDNNKKVLHNVTNEHKKHDTIQISPNIEHNIHLNSILQSHIFPISPTVNPIRKTQNDWITINDPQVDECARELMECFLKWKNSDFISNWTYSEYTHCKDYYYSLVFGDLKSPEALKGITEMMNMKYIHLLNIYYDSNIGFLCDYG